MSRAKDFTNFARVRKARDIKGGLEYQYNIKGMSYRIYYKGEKAYEIYLLWCQIKDIKMGCHKSI